MNSKFEPQSWSSCLKLWFHDVSGHGCQGSGLSFSKVRLLPTSPWPPLWCLGEPPSPQDAGEVKPNEAWEKMGSSLTFFPRGLGYDLEKKVPQGGWASVLQGCGGARGTLAGTSSHPAALGASAGLLNRPFFYQPENFPLCPVHTAVLVGSTVTVTIVSELTKSFRSSGYLGSCPEEYFRPCCCYCSLVLEWLRWILFPVQVHVAQGNRLQLPLASSWEPPST